MSTTGPFEVTARSRRPSARWRFFVAFLVGLIAVLALGTGVIYAYDRQYDGRILPGVRVGSADLSGMTPDEAEVALEHAYRNLGEGRIVLTTPDGPEVISYREIGRSLDTSALVAEAMVVGRDGSPIHRAVAAARIAVRGTTLTPRVVLDEDALAARVAEIATSLSIAPRDAAVTADDKLRFVVNEGSDGRQADPTEAIASLTTVLGALDAPSEVTAAIPTTAVAPTVTTAEATEAKTVAERVTARIDLVLDGKTVPIDTSKLRASVTFRTTAGGGYEPVVDTTDLETLLDGVAAKIDQKAINASFKVVNGKITAVTPSQTGYTLDLPGTIKQVESLLAARAVGDATTQIAPAVAVVEPTLTTKEAEAARPKMKKISEWTTYFPINDHNGYGANIWLPALAIDGTVVGPGETFDFWDAVGEVSTATGYRRGGAIINGKTEPQGALAGGICSCSTTLFNAALRAGFEMGARRNHYYYIDRYPLGLDATVFISASGSKQTMSWTNDTDYPVLIRGYKIRKGSSGYVRFALYSVPTGRKVVVGAPTVKNVRPASDTIEYTSTLAPGAKKRVEYPVDGKQVWRTVTVYDRAGKELHRVTYYSNYSRVTGLTLVGKPAATPAPATPAPATPAPATP
jgi:vancomycin resistance protein YoaR